MKIAGNDKQYAKKKYKRVFIRKRVKSPFPTNYLPTIPLKLSAVLRYYELKSEIKKTEKRERKDRELEISKYGTLTRFFEEPVEKYRNLGYSKGFSNVPRILLFKIHPKFESVLGKSVKLLSIQDYVKVLDINQNYELLDEEPYRLVYIKIGR